MYGVGLTPVGFIREPDWITRTCLRKTWCTSIFLPWDFLLETGVLNWRLGWGWKTARRRFVSRLTAVSSSIWPPRWNPMTRRPTISGNLFSYLLRSIVWHSNNCLRTVAWNYRQRKWSSPVVLVCDHTV